MSTTTDSPMLRMVAATKRGDGEEASRCMDEMMAEARFIRRRNRACFGWFCWRYWYDRWCRWTLIGLRADVKAEEKGARRV